MRLNVQCFCYLFLYVIFVFLELGYAVFFCVFAKCSFPSAFVSMSFKFCWFSFDFQVLRSRERTCSRELELLPLQLFLQNCEIPLALLSTMHFFLCLE